MKNLRQKPDELVGRRVLVVEDEGIVALDMESLLQDHGCTVIGPAATIRRALDLIASEDPDLAVLDLNLKGESALPIASALNERDIPFVVVSGYGRMLSGHPDLKDAPLLDKPVNHQALIRKLTEVSLLNGIQLN